MMIDHVHDLKLCPDGAYCTWAGCSYRPTAEQTEAMLNEHAKLKRATDALSAEQAKSIGDWMDTWRYEGMRNPYSSAIRDVRAYADALAEADDEWQKGAQEDMMKDEH